MDSPSRSKRSRLKGWAREARDDVRRGLGRVFGSTSRPSTPVPHFRQANRGVGEPPDSNEAAEPMNGGTLQVVIASPSPIRTQNTPPTLLGATSQLEHLSSTTPVPSSSDAPEIYPVSESSQTIIPDLAQYDSAPIAQETAGTDHPQEPLALPEAIPADPPIVDSQQALQASTPPDLQPSSSLELFDSPTNVQTAGQEGKVKAPSPWYSGVKATLALVERATDVFPPLKSAVAAINGILEVYDVSHQICLYHGRPFTTTLESWGQQTRL